MQQDNKLISIVVPVFNVAPYLPRCIESILAQVYSNWELLLVDDGSTDNSGTICDDYARADKRIIPIHTPNQGRSAARNFGLSKASGEWLAFLDSDDFVSPQYLQAMVKANPDWDAKLLVSQGFRSVNPDGTPNSEYPEALYGDWSFTAREGCDEISKNALLHIQAVWGRLFNMQKVKDNNLSFNLAIHHSEDGVFLHKYMLLCQNFSFISHQGYYYGVPIVRNAQYIPNYEELFELALFYENAASKLVHHFYIRNSQYKKRVYDFYQSRLSCLLFDNNCPDVWKSKAKLMSKKPVFQRPVSSLSDIKLLLRYLLV